MTLILPSRSQLFIRRRQSVAPAYRMDFQNPMALPTLFVQPRRDNGVPIAESTCILDWSYPNMTQAVPWTGKDISITESAARKTSYEET
jgi:hypothetical protein